MYKRVELGGETGASERRARGEGGRGKDGLESQKSTQVVRVPGTVVGSAVIRRAFIRGERVKDYVGTGHQGSSIDLWILETRWLRGFWTVGIWPCTHTVLRLRLGPPARAVGQWTPSTGDSPRNKTKMDVHPMPDASVPMEEGHTQSELARVTTANTPGGSSVDTHTCPGHQPNHSTTLFLSRLFSTRTTPQLAD